MVIETEREFGGNGSARIRVRVKRWKASKWIDGFRRLQVNWPRYEPPEIARGQRWFCPACGSPDCIAHVQCNNGKTIAPDYGRFPWTGGIGMGPMLVS